MRARYIVRTGFKPFIIYGIAILLLFVVCALFPFLYEKYLDLMYLLAFFLTLSAGIIHLTVLRGMLNITDPLNLKSALILTGALALIVLIVTSIMYYVLKLDFNFLSFEFAFLLPLLIHYAFIMYASVPSPIYRLWYYPITKIRDEIMWRGDTITQTVSFELSKRDDTDIMNRLKVEVPVDTPIGTLFTNLIDTYNKANEQDSIRYLNYEGDLIGWLFYLKRSLIGNKTLINPDLSLNENAVRPDEVIYVARESQV